MTELGGKLAAVGRALQFAVLLQRDALGTERANYVTTGVHNTFELMATAPRRSSTKSEARKRSHYTRPGQVSFDERSYKPATHAVESFGRLGKESSDLIDQMAASIVGGTDGSSLATKGICKERLFQIISVTTQVAL